MSDPSPTPRAAELIYGHVPDAPQFPGGEPGRWCRDCQEHCEPDGGTCGCCYDAWNELDDDH